MLALFSLRELKAQFFDKVGSAELEHKLTSVDLKFKNSFTVQKVGGGEVHFEIMYDALFELQ
jgi:hypothetical protein